jgi:hypothetical protein
MRDRGNKNSTRRGFYKTRYSTSRGTGNGKSFNFDEAHNGNYGQRKIKTMLFTATDNTHRRFCKILETAPISGAKSQNRLEAVA